MQLTCPSCGARHSIEGFLTDAAARETVAIALKMPAPLGDLVLRYIALFRPAQRALSWDRAARLLTELLAPIQAAQLERDGRSWVAPVSLWRLALEECLQARDKGTLQLPLKGHGYLFEIVARKASSTEAKQEAEREEMRRQRPEGQRSGATRSVADVVTERMRATWDAQLGLDSKAEE